MDRGSQHVSYQRKNCGPIQLLLRKTASRYQLSRTSLTLVRMSLMPIGVVYKGPLTGPEQYAANPPRGSPTHSHSKHSPSPKNASQTLHKNSTCGTSKDEHHTHHLSQGDGRLQSQTGAGRVPRPGQLAFSRPRDAELDERCCELH